MSKNWSHKEEEDAFSPFSQHPWRLRFRLSWQPELKWRLRETTGRHSTTHAQKHIFVQRRYTLRFFFLSFPSVSIHRPMNIVTAPTRVHNSCFWVTAFACRWTNAAIWNRWLAMHFGRKKKLPCLNHREQKNRRSVDGPAIFPLYVLFGPLNMSTSQLWKKQLEIVLPCLIEAPFCHWITKCSWHSREKQNFNITCGEMLRATCFGCQLPIIR